MANKSESTSTGLALLAVLAGGASAAAIDVTENYGFVHFMSHGWTVVAMSYLLVGLSTAAPTVLLRPVSAVVPVAAALVAVLAFFCGDLGYVLISAQRHHTSLDLLDYLRSYGEFQGAYTVGREAMAPLAALLLCGLRVRQVRVAAHRPRGRHAAGPAALESLVPERLRARSLDAPHHADID